MVELTPAHRGVLVGLSVLSLGGAGWVARRNTAPPLPLAAERIGVDAASSSPARAGNVAPRSGGASPRGAVAGAPFVVHVAGAVRKPGVYTLSADQRIVDAVRLAGGPTSRADTDAINLAAHITDGQQILIPRKDSRAGVGSTPRRRSGASSAHIPAGPIALNTASAEELDALPGVGPSTAANIIEYRDLNGPFATPDDLLNVKGIGPKKLERMKPYLAFQ